MCKQITNIHSIRSDKVRHLGFPAFRASAQGGDRYPKHGTDQSDRVLPQNRRRPDRTGKTGVRCPRSRSNPANQIAELSLKPKAGTFGCGHRNRERKKQGTDLMESLFPLLLIISLPIFSPLPQQIPKKPAQPVSDHHSECACIFDIPLLLFAQPKHEK